MELWMIRHALPVRIDGGHAPADPELAPAGVAQADRLASWWGPHGLDAIWSSPMRRAVETATPLAAALDLDIETHEHLREFDAHLSTYVPLEELRQDEAAWQRTVAEWRSPEAEAERRTFRSAVVAAIGAIAEAHPAGRVAVVCHGGVINAYLSHVLEIERTIFFEPAYTSVSRVVLGPRRAQLVSINEAPHLDVLTQPTRL